MALPRWFIIKRQTSLRDIDSAISSALGELQITKLTCEWARRLRERSPSLNGALYDARMARNDFSRKFERFTLCRLSKLTKVEKLREVDRTAQDASADATAVRVKRSACPVAITLAPPRTVARQ